jgi:hypothetical protein
MLHRFSPQILLALLADWILCFAAWEMSGASATPATNAPFANT